MIKHFRIVAVASVAALAFAACPSTLAHAQASDSAVSDRRDVDRSATDAPRDRLSTLKENLKLTAEQEKLWEPVEAALIDLRANRRAFASSVANDESPDQIERLRRRAELAAKRADALKKLAEAVTPLWATMSDDQKRDMAQRLAMGPGQVDRGQRMGHRHGGYDGDMRHHHRGDHDEGRSRSDRDRSSRDTDDGEWRRHRDRMMGRRGDDTDSRDYVRGDRLDRRLRDRDDEEWRYHRRDRMTDRRGDDDSDDRDFARSDRDRYYGWRSKDDDRPRARERSWDRRDDHQRSDCDCCRCNRCD